MHEDIIALNELNDIGLGDQAEAVYQAAQIYIRAGIYVVPLRPNSKILPETHTNINYGSASRKAAVIEKWFNPDGGRFVGWNIGIACGRSDGIFAVDIDVGGEISGYDTWNDIEDKNFKVNSPVQETPSGGMHMLFKWQENAVSSTGKIGPGIDTRGGEFNKCKSHIVAYPSTIDGKRYIWKNGGDIGPLPPFILKKLGFAWNQPAPAQESGEAIPPMGRGSEMVTDDDMEKQVPIEQIEGMVNAIDIDSVSYDDWLRIGQAIHSQHPEEGLVVWNNWSKKGQRYESNECTMRWRGFNAGGTVRIGTLFYHAREGGWVPEIDEIQPSKFDVEVEKLNQTFGVIMLGGKLKILRERRQDKFEVHEPHYDLLDREAFINMMENKQMIVVDSQGRPKYQSVGKIWLAHQGRREYLNGITLSPNKDKIGYYNTWKGFAYEAIQGECGLFVDHIRENLCNNDKESFTWLMDWAADLIQEPEDPKGCAVVLKGKEGTGKGIFGNVICELFGYHSVHMVDESHLTSNFNAHMADAIFVFADEVTWGGNKKSAGKLKGMVTERTVLVERKGVDAVPSRNLAHFLISSNEDWVIPAGAYSRRWFVQETGDGRRNDREYFQRMMHQMENGGYEALMYELANRTITTNLSKALETEALFEQRAENSSGDPTNRWWSEVLDRGSLAPYIGDWMPEVDRKEVYEIFKKWCADSRMYIPGNVQFYRKLRSYGAEDGRARKENEFGKRPAVFIFDEVGAMKENFKDVTGINLIGEFDETES